MTRPSAITIVIAIALLLAGTASFLVYHYLTKQGSKQRQGTTVAVAARDISVGAKLDATNLKSSVWPKENLPQQGYFPDAITLVGRVAVRQISAGDIVTEPKLMPLNRAEMGGVMTYIVPQGHRAVTVAVNEVAGVAGFITPNSRVDVVLTAQLNGTLDNKDDQLSKIILQNVPVLATGQVTEQKEGKPAIVPTVTLDLSPSDAEKLIVSAKKGSLQLLLRNVVDIAAVTTAGMTVARVLDGTIRSTGATPTLSHSAKRPPPAPRPPPKFKMEIIEGTAKSIREFPLNTIPNHEAPE